MRNRVRAATLAAGLAVLGLGEAANVCAMAANCAVMGPNNVCTNMWTYGVNMFNTDSMFPMDNGQGTVCQLSGNLTMRIFVANRPQPGTSMAFCSFMGTFTNAVTTGTYTCLIDAAGDGLPVELLEYSVVAADGR